MLVFNAPINDPWQSKSHLFFMDLNTGNQICHCTLVDSLSIDVFEICITTRE